MLTVRGLTVGHPSLRRVSLPRPGLRHLVRLLAFGLYSFAALAVFAILAPILPAAYQGAAYDVRTVVPGLHAPPVVEPPPPSLSVRTVKVKRAQSVVLLALRTGSTPFELYALNPATLDGPLVDRRARIRVPRQHS
jgi:hypothetical protein